MLTCKELAKALSSDELSTSGWRRRLAVGFHLLLCQHCRRYSRHLRQIGRAARELFGSEAEDAATLKRLEDSICRELLPEEGSQDEVH